MPSPLVDVVLASASPRRRQLLRVIGLRHRVVPAGVDETPRPGEDAAVFATRAAVDKAMAVVGRLPSAAVLGADTVVEVDDSILGKPASDAEARAMLERLAGRTHRVHTAVALAYRGASAALVDTATVRFLPLTAAAVSWYVSSGEPRDKAGAYAIQGLGGLLVVGIEGSPHTVVGLPIHRLAELFAACGLDLWAQLEPRRR